MNACSIDTNVSPQFKSGGKIIVIYCKINSMTNLNDRTIDRYASISISLMAGLIQMLNLIDIEIIPYLGCICKIPYPQQL